MKFASRFGLAAIAVALSFTTLSCTSQSPSGPVGVNQALEPGIGGSSGRPVPLLDPEHPTVLECQISLTGSIDGALKDTIPFSLSGENMDMASMAISDSSYNKFGCLTRVMGSLRFAAGNMYTFVMQVRRMSDCESDGGTLEVCNPKLGACKSIRLPSITSRGSVSSLRAN